MSGHKRTTISISEAEYRKLHEAEMKLRFMEKYLPEALGQARQEADPALNKALEGVEARQQAFAMQTRDLQQELKAVEWATSRAIIEQAAHFTQNLQSSQNLLWENLQSELEQFSQQFKAEIAYEHAQNQAEFGWLRQKLSGLEEEQQRKRELAIAWAQSAVLLDQFIQETYPPPLIDPQRFDTLEDELRQVFLNLEQDVPEAAIALAQQTYFRFSRLRVELENKTLQAELLYQIVEQSTARLLGWMESIRQVPALDLEGNPTGLWVDVDYWTDGRLQALIQQIGDHMAAFIASDARFDPELLKSLLDLQLPAWQKEAEDLVFSARLCVINSQIRINIAELIVRALQEQGFQLQEGSYRNNDMRDGFEALVQGLDGSEVLIRVNPLEDQSGSADVHLISLDQEMRTERELTQRARELGETLQRYGLAVGGQKPGTTYPTEAELAPRLVAEPEKAYTTARDSHAYA
ncbi:MAG: hypothetical protein HPY59_03680 [Anaerolineae bacterium]|nr:hypothetical protein [Anaerolineae bacterium]